MQPNPVVQQSQAGSMRPLLHHGWPGVRPSRNTQLASLSWISHACRVSTTHHVCITGVRAVLPVSCIAQAETASQDAQNETHLLHWDHPVPVAHQVPLQSTEKTEIHEVWRLERHTTLASQIPANSRILVLNFINAAQSTLKRSAKQSNIPSIPNTHHVHLIKAISKQMLQNTVVMCSSSFT